MELKDKVVVVTGGASGIGKAMSERFAAEGARTVVVADRHLENAEIVAKGIGGLAIGVDVSDPDAVAELVRRTEDEAGPIDLFCSNAGITGGGDIDTPVEVWDTLWQVNVMAHVHAAKAVLPSMLARGSGYLLNTASAAGLLMSLGDAPYSVTKHAAVAFAEYLAVTYHHRGIRVSCLCPQWVRTPMLTGAIDAVEGTTDNAAFQRIGGIIEPEEVAAVVVAGLGDERFLILPHPEVAKYMSRRGDDHERWLAGMRKLASQWG